MGPRTGAALPSIGTWHRDLEAMGRVHSSCLAFSFYLSLLSPSQPLFSSAPLSSFLFPTLFLFPQSFHMQQPMT